MTAMRFHVPQDAPDVAKALVASLAAGQGKTADGLAQISSALARSSADSLALIQRLDTIAEDLRKQRHFTVKVQRDSDGRISAMTIAETQGA